MNKIHLIEDDNSLGPTLKKSLESNNFEVTLSPSLAAARENSKETTYDLILLDWMLPDGEGIDFLKEVKDSAPVIMLTARADLIDKVLGLEGGASDYLTKPFELRELLARIRVQLRSSTEKSNEQSLEELKLHSLHFKLSERKIFYHEKEVVFTKMEFELLYLLATHPKQVFSREKLLDKVWGYEHYPTTRTVDTHVLQIRQKLDASVVETVRGIGYRFNPEHN